MPSPSTPAPSSKPHKLPATPPDHTSAEHIRQSWTKQTSVDISSYQQFPEMTKKNAKKPENSTKTDMNSNKIQQAVVQSFQSISPGVPLIPHTLVLNHQSGLGSISPCTPMSSGHPKTDHTKDSLLPPLFSLPLFVVSVKHALTSTELCAVMDRQEVTCCLDKSKRDSDSEEVLEIFFSRMEVVRQFTRSGLVHWGGGDVNWNVLGETEEQDEGYRRSQWWDGVVGSRTRVASRFRGWWGGNEAKEDMHQDEDVEKDKSHMEGVKQATVDNIDSQDTFKCGNMTTAGNSDSDDEDWYRKKKHKEGGEKTKTKEVEGNDSFSSPFADDSYLNTLGTITRSTLSSLAHLGSVTITDVPGKATEDTEDEERLLSERQTDQAGGENSEVVEKRGTCPLCQLEMGMKTLLDHAATCQG